MSSRFSIFSWVLVLALAAAPLAAQQPNISGVSSMVIGGVGAAPAVGPFQVAVPPSPNNTTLTMVMSGPANTPWVLGNANPGLGGYTSFVGGTPTPFGMLDILPLSLPPIEIVIDGVSGVDPILRALANTGTTGSVSYPLTFLAPPCPAVHANLQAMMLTIAPPGYSLTAAYEISTGLAMDAAPVAVTGASDDSSTQYAFNGCTGFDFYGTVRSTYRANSNGNVTFGASFTTLTESQTTFNANAMIAGLWDDLNINTGGTFMKFDNGTLTSIAWNQVPEYSVGGANTFNITMVRPSGDIIITYGACSSLDSLVGITQGVGAAPVTVFGPSALNGTMLSHLGGGPAYFGAPTESLNELFTSPATATSSTFNLSGATVTFLKTGPSSYTMY